MATHAHPDEFVEQTTAAAIEEKAKLQKHFGRFDMFFFLICTLVGLDTLGAVSSYGAQAFTWLAVLGVFFFVPYALLTAELGSTFHEEGGAYVWTKLAFGRFVAAINAVLYWLSNPIWLGGTLTITAVTVFNEFFTPLGNWKYLFSLAFIWFAVWSAILSFGVGKWIPTIGAWARMLLLGFFTFTVILYAGKHGVHGVGHGDFKPTWAIFIAAAPVLFFNYVGFELPNSAGDEMKDPQRDVPFTVLRSAVGTFLLYGAPILAILLVLPAAQITSLGGFIDAMKTVSTVYGGHVTTASDGTVTATLTGAGKLLGDRGEVHDADLDLHEAQCPWRDEQHRSVTPTTSAHRVDRVRGACRREREQEQDIAQQRIARVEHPRIDVVKPSRADERRHGAETAAITQRQPDGGEDQNGVERDRCDGAGDDPTRSLERLEVRDQQQAPNEGHNADCSPQQGQCRCRLGPEPEPFPTCRGRGHRRFPGRRSSV